MPDVTTARLEDDQPERDRQLILFDSDNDMKVKVEKKLLLESVAIEDVMLEFDTLHQDPRTRTHGKYLNADGDEMDVETNRDAEDDPVVQEIPIHFATEMGTNLRLIQFPTRPMHDSLPTEGRIKRNKMQMKIPLDTQGPHYSQEDGRQFGRGVGFDPIFTAIDSHDDFDRTPQKLEYMTLESTPVPMNARYMVGVMSDGTFK
jgi:RPC5 protein